MSTRPSIRLLVSLWTDGFAVSARCLTLLSPGKQSPSRQSRSPARMRQPVALAVTDGGKTLFVANRRSGSVSVVDATDAKGRGRIRCWPRFG